METNTPSFVEFILVTCPAPAPRERGEKMETEVEIGISGPGQERPSERFDNNQSVALDSAEHEQIETAKAALLERWVGVCYPFMSCMRERKQKIT